jgi:hypothetical protein
VNKQTLAKKVKLNIFLKKKRKKKADEVKLSAPPGPPTHIYQKLLPTVRYESNRDAYYKIILTDIHKNERKKKMSVF